LRQQTITEYIFSW